MIHQIIVLKSDQVTCPRVALPDSLSACRFMLVTFSNGTFFKKHLCQMYNNEMSELFAKCLEC